MSAVFLKILNMSIAASFLILAVVAARFLLKKAPKWIACVLWALAAVRLVCPFSLESALSLIPSAETLPRDIMLSPAPAVQTGLSFVNEAVNPVIVGSFTPQPWESANPLQILIPLLAAVWLAGVGAMLLYALISYSRLKSGVAASIPAAENVYACDTLFSPFILGVFRPRIYVPSSLSGETLESVLAHERAHIARRDQIWKPLGFALLAVHWFNPLCWLGYILLCRDIEAACDEKVVRGCGRAQIAAYSQALLACALPRRRIAACPLAFGEVGVKQRVKNVLNYKKPAFWLILAAIAACAAVAVFFLTDPKPDGEPDSPFGKEYLVSAIVYESGLYDYSYPSAADAPRYRVESDGTLYVQEADGGEWARAGKFEETELTQANFDAYFRGSRGSTQPLRQQNEQAWRLLVSGNENAGFYYLLRQKSGAIYLTYGYYDPEGESDPDSDDSVIRWVFALCFPADRAEEPDLSLLNYKNAVSTAADKDEVTAICCPPREENADGVIVPGFVSGPALAQYLSRAEWTVCSAPEKTPASPGSIEFVIDEEYRITVYQAHRLAKVVLVGDTRWYIRGRSDYEDAAALFQSRSLSDAGEALDADDPAYRIMEINGVIVFAYDLATLREQYPEYFDLDTSKGLEVYVWQMAPDSYSCGLLPGTNREKTNEELWSLRAAGVGKMSAILSSYRLSPDEIAVIPIRQPYSSYAYTIDEDYAKTVRPMFFPAE